MALTYGLVIAEYLLAAGALYGAVRIAIPLPPGLQDRALLVVVVADHADLIVEG